MKKRWKNAESGWVWQRRREQWVAVPHVHSCILWVLFPGHPPVGEMNLFVDEADSKRRLEVLRNKAYDIQWWYAKWLATVCHAPLCLCWKSAFGWSWFLLSVMMPASLHLRVFVTTQKWIKWWQLVFSSWLKKSDVPWFYSPYTLHWFTAASREKYFFLAM